MEVIMAIFSKRHYDAIANVLHDCIDEAYNGDQRTGIRSVAYKLSILFERDSIKFDKDRFLILGMIESETDKLAAKHIAALRAAADPDDQNDPWR
jgi:hypothetical protein